MSDILNEELQSIERQEDTDTFTADWAFQQAYRNGQKKALRKIMELLNV